MDPYSVCTTEYSYGCAFVGNEVEELDIAHLDVPPCYYFITLLYLVVEYHLRT
jgi:hypothetical protein